MGIISGLKSVAKSMSSPFGTMPGAGRAYKMFSASPEAGLGFIPGGQHALNYVSGKENLGYQKGVQAETWSREDTSIQRRVADLKSAGLSPVLAAGQGASSGPIVSTSAPQMSGSMTESIAALMKMQQDISTSAAQESLLKMQATKTVGDTLKTLEELENIRADTSNKYIKNQAERQDLEIQQEIGGTSSKSGLQGLLKDMSAVFSGGVGPKYEMRRKVRESNRRGSRSGGW